MGKKINVAELLKDCPQGMELYSPIFGKCKFECISNIENQIVIRKNNNTYKFTEDGQYLYLDGECVLFPSNEQRDWSKFQRPFKDGDVISNDVCTCIYNGNENDKYYGSYVSIGHIDFPNYFINRTENNYFTKGNTHLATKEEKQKLFDAIKENGYRWNDETKTLEKLIERKFKVGDRIKNKNSGICDKVIKIFEDCYLVESCLDEQATIDFDIQDNWELVPNKFDITTLKPFDKVLVRDSYKNMWCASIFSHTWKDKYFCIGAWYNQCIPYEANKELLGTTNDCGWFYKNWEEE